MTALLRKDRSGEISRRDKAFRLIREKSFSNRSVQLSSGASSNFYFDMKFTMLDPLGANLLAQLVLDKIPRNIAVDYVGGLELGAVPLIGPIVALSYQQDRAVPGLIVRKEAKKHGSQRLIEGAANLAGKNVVIVDDVTTSGASAMKSIQALKDEGANIVLVISIVDREQGATELYRAAGLPFDPLFRASEFLNT